MDQGRGMAGRGSIALILAACALLTLPAAAAATAPQGPNGRIAFTSGRDDGATPLSDMNAQIWILGGPGAAATRLTNTTADNTLHHRHPTWSPDRTKIAYAQGPSGFGGPWSIWVRDLTQPLSATNPLNVTPDAESEDRPSWSPDGTRIAYQKEGVGTNLDIYVVNANGTGEIQVANPADATSSSPASPAPRPSWSADSQSIYYAKLISAGDNDIYVVPADGSNPSGNSVISATTFDDTQPQVSPDGSKLCFTRSAGANKDIFTVPINGFGATSLGTDSGQEFECSWSPDGSRIAFVRGAFGAGEILVRNSNATGNIDPVTDVGGRFDGNPDWTMNASPVCQSATVNAGSQSSVSLQLACSDQGPAAEQTAVTKSILTNPLSGVLGPLAQGDPATVSYGPNAGFAGSDTISFRGNDGTSDSAPATITINVDRLAAAITSASMRTRWRRGSLLPRVSRVRRRRSPIGTTIRFRLNEAARVTLTFHKPALGRRVGRRCLAPTRARRRRPRCTRYLFKGSMSFNGKVGLNSVRFQGRITRTRRLGLGRHRVTIAATDSAGNRSRTRSLFFTIVAF